MSTFLSPLKKIMLPFFHATVSLGFRIIASIFTANRMAFDSRGLFKILYSL